MTAPLDDPFDLYMQWQESPDIAGTIALCDALRGSSRLDLIEVVGSHASRQLDVHALTAAARMYADADRLDDAQHVLLAAGRLAPRDGDVFRFLGEILLRRGDAERAEKVLEHAIEFGSSDSTAYQWLERARAARSSPRASGKTGVAESVAKASESHAIRRPLAQLRAAPDEAETEVRKNDDVKEALAAVLPARAPPTQAQTAPAKPKAREAAPEDEPLPRARRTSKPPRSRAEAPRPPPPVAPGFNPFLVPPATVPLVGAAALPLPDAQNVLAALEIAGLFEPESARRTQARTWEKPAAAKFSVRGLIVLGTLAAVTVVATLGTYLFVTDKRAREHIQAEALLADVDARLSASDARLLASSEKALASAFELDSRSPHAALTWLHERALVGFLKGGENIAFADGTQRANELGIPENRVAFTHVASFLFQRDTGGAAAAVAKWDDKAKDDPWYQLAAGATFERAGDARDLERYDAAVKLDPNLFVSQLLLARATAVDGDPRRASELAKQLRVAYPDRVEGVALTALAWARDPFRGEPPLEAKDVVIREGELPAPLKAVAPAVRALLAIEQHKVAEAKTALQQGLGVADTPGLAAWLGSIALATGDETLARKGALAALSFSAVYPPARMLAARVALLGARLDEALKASEELPPASSDVVFVTAAVAYERLDGERLREVLGTLSEDAKKLPFLAPLVRGEGLMSDRGKAFDRDKLVAMASDDAPWADLIAMDALLDAGEVELASKVASTWPSPPKPLQAIRLSRLARWEGKPEDAEKLSRAALETGTVTVRALAERVFVLVAAGKYADVIALFKAYPNVGGTLARWLRAYALGSHGKIEEARAIVSQEDPPSTLSPLAARAIAAMTFGALKDSRRGKEYIRAVVAAGFSNPDLTIAATRVGAGSLARKR